MVLPGVQALFGFQLIAAFNQRFVDLEPPTPAIHFASLLLVALAIGLLMAPASYHRIRERTIVSSYFTVLSSRLVAAAMIPLALAIAMDVYVVGEMIFPGMSSLYTSAFGVLVFVALFLLWIVFPLVHGWTSRGGK